MSPRLPALLLVSLGLVATPVRAAPADGDCRAARPGPSIGALPATWKAAVLRLIAATAEPGHPWSCGGGTVDLTADGDRMRLQVARDGEPAITRSITTPDDVVPLGEALLASPLLPPAPPKPAPSASVETAPASAASHAAASTTPPDPVAATVPAPSAAPTTERAAPRILLGAAIDGRWVGGPDLPWAGPSLRAAVPLGRWLPALVLRQQSALSRRPHLDEISAALGLDRSFVWPRWEARAGAFIRAASVQRDVPGTRGEQSRVEGRAGLGTAVVVPVRSWLRIVATVDGELVLSSRARSESSAATEDEPPRPFPKHTLGGSLGIEVPL